MTAIEGGCLCGDIRFSATADPENPHFCSCRQCQRWSGAPVVAWVDFPAAALTFNGPAGEPAWYRSSAGAERGFCRRCGGTIAAREDRSDRIGVTTASLDDPNGPVPLRQSFPESAPVWLRVGVMPGAGRR